jgi:hypothetical protein
MILASVVVELHCKLLVDDILLPVGSTFSLNLELIFMCKASLFFLQNFRINFIMRRTNSVVHSLTRASLFFVSIKTILINEMS